MRRRNAAPEKKCKPDQHLWIKAWRVNPKTHERVFQGHLCHHCGETKDWVTTKKEVHAER